MMDTLDSWDVLDSSDTLNSLNIWDTLDFLDSSDLQMIRKRILPYNLSFLSCVLENVQRRKPQGKRWRESLK